MSVLARTSRTRMDKRLPFLARVGRYAAEPNITDNLYLAPAEGRATAGSAVAKVPADAVAGGPRRGSVIPSSGLTGMAPI